MLALRIGVGPGEVTGGRGAHCDDAETVGGDVVQFAGDAKPFLLGGALASPGRELTLEDAPLPSRALDRPHERGSNRDQTRDNHRNQ